jgi:diacylglycerol kinase (ATP)
VARRSLFIVNPIARGSPSLDKLRMAAAWLETQGWEAEVALTERPGHASELARDAAASGCDVVVACGGDGTVNEAANGLAGSDTALAVIRGGTANVWAKEVGIPRDPLSAARLISEGRRRRVDLGVVEAADGRSRFFLMMAGVGIDGHVVRLVPEGLKKRLGAAAYVLYAFRENFRYRARPTSLVIDGETSTADLVWLLASNTRSYGGVLNVAYGAKADDGLLDVYVFEGGGFRRNLLYTLRILVRRHERARGVTYQRARRVELPASTDLECQVDGEVLGFPPHVIRVAPAALTVVVPDAHNALFCDGTATD